MMMMVVVAEVQWSRSGFVSMCDQSPKLQILFQKHKQQCSLRGKKKQINQKYILLPTVMVCLSLRLRCKK